MPDVSDNENERDEYFSDLFNLTEEEREIIKKAREYKKNKLKNCNSDCGESGCESSCNSVCESDYDIKKEDEENLNKDINFDPVPKETPIHYFKLINSLQCPKCGAFLSLSKNGERFGITQDTVMYKCLRKSCSHEFIAVREYKVEKELKFL